MSRAQLRVWRVRAVCAANAVAFAALHGLAVGRRTLDGMGGWNGVYVRGGGLLV